MHQFKRGSVRREGQRETRQQYLALAMFGVAQALIYSREVVAELRWLTGRTDSPWYPSMRIFRQRELGAWDTVIEEVRDALTTWCEVERQ